MRKNIIRICKIMLILSLLCSSIVYARQFKSNRTDMTVKVGQTKTIKTSGAQKKVAWTATDSKVVSIKVSPTTKSVKISGTAPGETTIIASSNDQILKIKVTVLQDNGFQQTQNTVVNSPYEAVSKFIDSQNGSFTISSGQLSNDTTISNVITDNNRTMWTGNIAYILTKQNGNIKFTVRSIVTTVENKIDPGINQWYQQTIQKTDERSILLIQSLKAAEVRQSITTTYSDNKNTAGNHITEFIANTNFNTPYVTKYSPVVWNYQSTRSAYTPRGTTQRIQAKALSGRDTFTLGDGGNLINYSTFDDNAVNLYTANTWVRGIWDSVTGSWAQISADPVICGLNFLLVDNRTGFSIKDLGFEKYVCARSNLLSVNGVNTYEVTNYAFSNYINYLVNNQQWKRDHNLTQGTFFK